MIKHALFDVETKQLLSRVGGQITSHDNRGSRWNPCPVTRCFCSSSVEDPRHVNGIAVDCGS